MAKCAMDNCDSQASRVVVHDSVPLAVLCERHEWEMMRRIRDEHRTTNSDEAERGWWRYCYERGFDPTSEVYASVPNESGDA